MKAISKINLFLEVLGRREDSYHEIRTVFYPIDFIYDDIEIEKDENGIRIETDDPNLPVDEDNLCWKAAAKFAEISGLSPCWKIKIQKRVPISAGLGGGSSDAATVLKILDNMYPKRCEIRKIASKLGADASYFMDPVLALGEGAGERLTPLALKLKIPLLIVNPLFPVSAKWAYKNYFAVSKISFDEFMQSLGSADTAKIAKNLRNDLAPALYRKFPILEMLKNSLLEFGALGAEISGSGSSLFAIFSNSENTLHAKKEMKKKFGQVLRIFSY